MKLNLFKKLKSNRSAQVFVLTIFLVTLLSPNISNAQVLTAQALGKIAVGGWTAVGEISLDLIAKIPAVIMEFAILPVVGFISGLSGMFLGWAIEFSLNTGYIFASSSAINLGWTIVRDFVNMFFIFILIFISFAIILRLSKYDTKKMLAKVIVAALLINFSLFFTKAIVDVGNIFARWANDGVTKSLGGAPGTNIAGLLGNKIGLVSIWNGQPSTFSNIGAGAKNLVENTSSAIELGNSTRAVIRGVFKMIIGLIMAFVFTYVAILFLGRAITILFLLIFSPIMFLGKLIPRLDEYVQKWWDNLWDAVTFPVVFLLMLFLASQFIKDIEKIIPSNVSAWDRGGVAALVEVGPNDIFYYIFIIGLLIACLKIAKETSGSAGKFFGGIGGAVAGFVTGSIVGGGAKFARHTVGRQAAGFAGSEFIQSNIDKGGIRGALAHFAETRAINTSKRSFDPRAGAIGKAIAGSGVDMDKPDKIALKGYAGEKKARDEYVQERAEKRKPSEEDIEKYSGEIDDINKKATQTILANELAPNSELGAKFADNSKLQEEYNGLNSAVGAAASGRQKDIQTLQKEISDLGGKSSGDVQKLQQEIKELEERKSSYAKATSASPEIKKEIDTEIVNKKSALAELRGGLDKGVRDKMSELDKLMKKPNEDLEKAEKARSVFFVKHIPEYDKKLFAEERKIADDLAKVAKKARDDHGADSTEYKEAQKRSSGANEAISVMRRREQYAETIEKGTYFDKAVGAIGSAAFLPLRVPLQVLANGIEQLTAVIKKEPGKLGEAVADAIRGPMAIQRDEWKKLAKSIYKNRAKGFKSKSKDKKEVVENIMGLLDMEVPKEDSTERPPEGGDKKP